jgi:hypothetical protein
MNTVRVRVVRSHVLGWNRFAEVGDILDLPESVAVERVNNGSCELAPQDPAPEGPAAAAADELTQNSAGADPATVSNDGTGAATGDPTQAPGSADANGDPAAAAGAGGDSSTQTTTGDTEGADASTGDASTQSSEAAAAGKSAGVGTRRNAK